MVRTHSTRSVSTEIPAALAAVSEDSAATWAEAAAVVEAEASVAPAVEATVASLSLAP